MGKEVRKSKQMDMLNGSLTDKIVLFALPLAASSILQQLFNSADVAVAGRFAGSQALAAVGGNSYVINLLVNLFVGFSVGANVVIANYAGQGRKEKCQEAVHCVMALSVLCGVFLAFAGIFLAKPILRWMDTPAEVLPLATLYLRIYFGGMVFFMVYNFGAAVLRSAGDTKKPLYCLMFSGTVNVLLNLLLVIVFRLSVAGVAIATVTANAISAGLIVRFLTRAEETIRLDLKKLAFHKEEIVKVIRIGGPAGLQGMVFSLSNVCIQTAVNSFGTRAIAGSAAAANYEFFTYFATTSFTQACVTFTSQNYGARQYGRCIHVWKRSLLSGILCTGIMSAVFVLGRRFFVGIYTADPAAVQYGMARMTCVELFTWMPPIYEVTGGAMRGLGDSMMPAALTVFGSCVLRIVWIQTVFRYFQDFRVLMWVYPFTWVVTSTLVVGAYLIRRRKAFR